MQMTYRLPFSRSPSPAAGLMRCVYRFEYPVVPNTVLYGFHITTTQWAYPDTESLVIFKVISQ